MVMTWLPKWSEFTMVLLAAWLVAGMFTGSPVVDISNQTDLLGVEKDSVSFEIDEEFLKSVPLFGQASSTASKLDKPVVTASKLNVKLIGTIVAGEKSAAVVVVNGGKKQQLFFVGESLQPRVKLHGVEVLEITVDNNGKIERIGIEAGKKIVSVNTSRVRSGYSRPARVRKIDRSVNKGHLQKQLRNFSTLLSQARVTPHFTNKKPDGFTISEIVKGSFYEEVGLQNGDIIQKVNGESVTGAEQAMRMYRELQNATSIDVEILRGGAIQRVSYTIQ